MSEMQSKQLVLVLAGEPHIFSLSPTAEIHRGLALILLLVCIHQNCRTSSVKHSASSTDDQCSRVHQTKCAQKKDKKEKTSHVVYQKCR